MGKVPSGKSSEWENPVLPIRVYTHSRHRLHWVPAAEGSCFTGKKRIESMQSRIDSFIRVYGKAFESIQNKFESMQNVFESMQMHELKYSSLWSLHSSLWEGFRVYGIIESIEKNASK